MKDHSRYWLRLVQEYTDLAVMACDEGMSVAGIPPSVVRALGVRVRKRGGRVVITQAGRNFLKNKGE